LILPRSMKRMEISKKHLMSRDEVVRTVDCPECGASNEEQVVTETAWNSKYFNERRIYLCSECGYKAEQVNTSFSGTLLKDTE
jgi:C4-type Zn-finger protein